mgnify:CR=1 FL=1
MDKIVYLVRFRQTGAHVSKTPIAYSHSVEQVRDFLERYDKETHDLKNNWFIGFTEHLEYPITKLPTIERLIASGTNQKGKF